MDTSIVAASYLAPPLQGAPEPVVATAAGRAPPGPMFRRSVVRTCRA